MIQKISSFLLKITFSLLLTLLLIEIGLRLFPGVIPLPLLIYFAEEPRGEIAARQGLPTRWGTVLIERDDGGPELRVPRPFFRNVVFARGEELVLERDEMGFCNEPGSYQPETIPVLAIGDSFTGCSTGRWADSWTTKLGERLGRPVYNLGKGGIGVHEYLQILKHFGLQKSPEIVLMTIYEGNDLRDATVFHFYRGGSAEVEVGPEAETIDGAPLWAKSYAYNLFNSALQVVSGAEPNLDENATLDRSSFLLQNFAFLPEEERAALYGLNFEYTFNFPEQAISFNPDNADRDEAMTAKLMYHELAPDVFDQVTVEMTAALAEFVALSETYDFVPVVAYMPSAHTVYADFVQFTDPSLEPVMPWFSAWQRSFFARQGRALGYHFIDLTPGLQTVAREKGSQALMHHFRDLHLTEAGHIVVADLLAQEFRELDLVSGQKP